MQEAEMKLEFDPFSRFTLEFFTFYTNSSPTRPLEVSGGTVQKQLQLSVMREPGLSLKLNLQV